MSQSQSNCTDHVCIQSGSSTSPVPFTAATIDQHGTSSPSPSIFSRMSTKNAARWKFIKQIIHKQQTGTENIQKDVSVRRHQGFQLLPCTSFNNINNDRTTYQYLQYTLPNNKQPIIRIHRSEAVSLHDVKSAMAQSIDNTGNICIWPSEEILTYIALKHVSTWNGKRIIELGSGMTALCSIGLLCTNQNIDITITDGNEHCIQQLQYNVQTNNTLYDSSNQFHCELLKWNRNQQYVDRYHKDGKLFDIILISDCLFFRDYHLDLCHVITSLLAKDGICMIIAPKRGHSLQTFVQLFQEKYTQFTMEVQEQYDADIWEKHLYFVEQTKQHEDSAIPVASYDPDIHYPLLIKIKHGAST